MSQNLKSWLIFIVLVLIWGSAFILTKRGLVSFNAYQVASIRVLAATTVLAPFAIGKLRNVKKREWLYIVISGFVGSFTPALLFAYGMENGISSSSAGVLSALTPAFTLVLSIILFKQRFGLFQFIGLALGFIGAISLLINKSGAEFQFNNYGWFIVLATFMYALNLTLVKFRLKETDSMLISSFSLISTLPVTVGYLLYSDFVNRMEVLEFAYTSLGYTVLLGVLATGIALQLFNMMVKSSSPIFTSSVTYAIPVMSIFWALLDGESVSMNVYLATTVIMLSIYLIRKNA